jgi:hypothetical protein
MLIDSAARLYIIPGTRQARRYRAVPLFAGWAVIAALWFSLPALAAADGQADCSAGSAASAACGGHLSEFSQAPGSEREAAAPSSGKLGAYNADAQTRTAPPSMDQAISKGFSNSIRIARWTSTTMISMGLLMMFTRKWITQRIRQSDEEGTRAARRLLEQSESLIRPLPPVSIPQRRIEWTPERISALDDQRYAHLCVGYWETKGYVASLGEPDSEGSYRIELRRPDRRDLAGLVCFLPRDDGRNGLDAVRDIQASSEQAKAGMAALMTRGVLSDAANSRAASAGLQVIDGSALLNQLRTLSQDQQETLVAELDAYTPL